MATLEELPSPVARATAFLLDGDWGNAASVYAPGAHGIAFFDDLLQTLFQWPSNPYVAHTPMDVARYVAVIRGHILNGQFRVVSAMRVGESFSVLADWSGLMRVNNRPIGGQSSSVWYLTSDMQRIREVIISTWTCPGSGTAKH